MTNPPSVPSLDVEACVRLLTRFVWASVITPVGWSTPGVYLTKEEQALIDALASALPGMGKDSDGWKHASALSADLTSMAKARDAWRLFGEHVAHCVECGETSYENCHEGSELFKAAEAADDVLDHPIRSAARAAQPEETSADGR